MTRKKPAELTNEELITAIEESNRSHRESVRQLYKNKKERVKMAGISLDFSAVTSFEPVPTDTYEVVFTGGKVRDNRRKDGQVFVAELTIENHGADFDGRKVFHGFSLKPQALWALKDFLLACDIDEDEFTEDADLEQLIKDASGAHLLVDVVLKPNEEKEGKYFNETDNFRSNN